MIVSAHCTGKVLLVDDHSVNRLMAQTMLEQMGVEVQIACNGLEAVEAWTKEHFDLVLMDIQMPKMDGYEATNQIRTFEKTHNKSHTPIIAMTANAMLEDRQACLKEGMDDHLPKPFKYEQLESILHNWIQESPLKINETETDVAVSAKQDTHNDAESVIDTEQVKTSQEILGDQYPQLVKLTLESMAQSLRILKQSADDFTQLTREAHRLKGAMGTIGAIEMKKLSRKLELAAKAEDRETAQLLLNDLPVAAQRLEKHLEESLQTQMKSA